MTVYATIQADPPWEYRQVLGRGKRAGDSTRGGLPYPSMTVEEIMALPIGDYAAKDCMLWLWSTNSHLHDAFHVMDAWGFQYKSMVTWAKTQMGLGFWLRGKTEHLLLGVRGKPRSKFTGPHGATGNSWTTLIEAPRGRHSEKPPIFTDLMEDLGEPPRLEIFARRCRLGWDAIGDEWYDLPENFKH